MNQEALTLQVGYDKKYDLWFASVMDGDQRKPVNRFSTFETFVQDLVVIHGYELPPNMISELLYLKILPVEVGDWKADLQGWRPLDADQSTCWTCRQDCDPAYLSGRNCLECREPYTPTELAAIEKFVEGYVACLTTKKPTELVAVDEWCSIPSDPTIDIHFMMDHDEESESFSRIQAWAYRRDKFKLGDCNDELRVK